MPVINLEARGWIERRLQEAVEGAALPASFHRLLLLALQQPGKVLAGESQPRWPALVLAGCRAAGGNERAATTVAAAVELFMAGLDILDEIEDGDHSPLVDEAGVAQALNVSTALLLLAHRLLNDLAADGVAPERVPAFGRTLATASLRATGGQHLDLATEGRSDISTADALDIARRKAGALVGGVCRLGALLGTDDEELLALYETWGCHHGTAAQLANDLHDARDIDRKSDGARGKGTLPLIFNRHAVRETASGWPADAAAPQDLAAGGALHFTWVVLEIERQASASVLDQLAARGQSIAQLRTLI